MLHELKILEQYADAVYYGLKTFEIRYKERGYEVGDKIHFTVYKDGEYVEHPLNYKFYEIKYILWEFEGLKEGYVALAIEPYIPPQQEKIVTTLNGEPQESFWTNHPNDFRPLYDVTCEPDFKLTVDYNELCGISNSGKENL